MNFRQIHENDWVAIEEVQEICYPPVACEGIESLRCHWLVSPETCFVLADDRSIAGYFLSHPWPRRLLPPLKKVYDSVPATSDALFIHDFAILPAWRRKGFGARAVDRALKSETCRSLPFSALISVQGTRPFWERHGFASVSDITDLFRPELDAFYPEGGCCYMERANRPATAA